jgi:hypothetical protein
MLMHYFWLLELKFKFEFYLFEAFAKTLIPKPQTLNPFPPSSPTASRGPRKPASSPARQQQAAAALTAPATQRFGPASRPTSRFSPPQPLPVSAAVADLGDPPVIP